MGASLAADFPVEMVSQPLRGVRSAKLAVQGLPCIAWYGRLVHGNPLPLGMGSGQKDKVYRLALEGQVIESPQDAVKDPYVLEFLGLPELPAYSETELESRIIDHLQQFLLELGTGFAFIGRQVRFTFDEEHFIVDLVFYNRLLRCFVLFDLKIGELKHQDIGQMQMYVNYYDRKVKLPDENPTIGIILCKDKNNAVVEMTLPEDNAQIFASKYQTVLPSKEDLQRLLEEQTSGNDTSTAK